MRQDVSSAAIIGETIPVIRLDISGGIARTILPFIHVLIHLQGMVLGKRRLNGRQILIHVVKRTKDLATLAAAHPSRGRQQMLGLDLKHGRACRAEGIHGR
jgi:hypothetical protein